MSELKGICLGVFLSQNNRNFIPTILQSAIVLILTFVLNLNTYGKEAFDFKFKDQKITTVLEKYSEYTGEKFIVSPNVVGKITIIMPKKSTKTEAFNAISSSLALHGYTWIKEGDFIKVLTVRAAQRDNLEVFSNELPPEQPVRLVTYIHKFKKAKAANVFKSFRSLNSKDGETQVIDNGNKLSITDFSSNIQRISKLLNEFDN